MFFIDARAEISVAESRFHLQKKHRSPRRMPRTGREGQAIDLSIPWRFLRWGSLVARRHARRGRGEALVRSAGAPCPCGTPQLLNTFAGSFCCAGFDNDPSAGSPTETLLRLILPLNDKVQWTSRDVAGSEPPTSPRSEHFTGSFNRYAHTRTLLRKSRSVGGAPFGGIPPSASLALRVYSPVDTHTCQTAWSVFQDGSNGEPTGQRPERADAKAHWRRALPATIEETAFHERIESPGFGRPPNLRWSTPRVDRRTGLLPFHIRPGCIAG
ncbi:hypothetical protein CQW23_34192 [Capsicum baccatum]|uniref:Protein TAR1 n=1 Tax=Capsicum baccatum TaxID=33114 RepID=A0A2G2UZR0_CAPBA|nr:hypothetical protein CQW23_34192 [Capsicum baccatum]